MGKKRKSKKGLIILIIVLVLVFSFLISVFNKSLPKVDGKNRIAVIPINGIIVSGNGQGGFFSESGVDSGTIVSFIEAADKDKNVKGIILNINSGGGAVVPSKEIADAVKKVNKPVVALIKDVGASGAYWVASAADYIIADPLSITGSIGVAAGYLEFSKLMSDYGVTYQRLISGEFKDLGTPYANLSDAERNLLQGKINKIHDYFVKDVSKNRGKDLSPYATGLFYLGSEAVDIGMVDALGGKEEAINKTLELANITEYELMFYRKQAGFLDILQRLSSDFGFSVGEGIGSSFLVKDNTGIRLE